MKYITVAIVSCLVAMPLMAAKRVVVDLSAQKAYLYQDGRCISSSRISSGKKGRRTPLGNFRILEKDKHHVSNLWPKPNGGAKMPYMMRLTHGGIAMHLGRVPKYPASHGCIRLQNGFAQKVYAWAEVGTMVNVVRHHQGRVKGLGEAAVRVKSPKQKAKERRAEIEPYIRQARETRRVNPYLFDDTLEMLEQAKREMPPLTMF